MEATRETATYPKKNARNAHVPKKRINFSFFVSFICPLQEAMSGAPLEPV